MKDVARGVDDETLRLRYALNPVMFSIYKRAAESSWNQSDGRSPLQRPAPTVRELLFDVRAGMNHIDLMKKHGLKPHVLRRLLRRLAEASLIDPEISDMDVSRLGVPVPVFLGAGFEPERERGTPEHTGD
jgi:hypothetical protein